MNDKQPQSFGKIRNFFWPIYGHELKKLIPIFTLFFLISFVYNLLRCMKIALIVTAEGSGAEAIPFLKLYVVLPGALLLTYLFTKLANRYNREQVFYLMLTIFLGFFIVFMLLLYPNREALELRSFADWLQQHLPEGLKGLIAIVRHWTLSLFYVVSELWSTVVLSMLFWGFANEVTTIDEAKRFYAIFALGANASGIFSGQFAQLLTVKDFNDALPFGTTPWEQSLFLLLSAILICGGLIMILFRWVNLRIEREERLRIKPASELLKKKVALSLSECFAYLGRSRYMMYIAVIVVSYNLVYNLADVLWTDQVSQRYPDTSEFNAYVNNITSLTGALASVFALVISGNVIRRYGWTAAAMITPVIWLLTSVGFFACMLSENTALGDVFFAMFSTPLTTITILFGSAQYCLGRASKYTVFDETKEIAFIPLPKESQRKGKAVVDGIASRFGKSGGSLIYQVLLVVCADLALTTPYIAGIILISITVWIIAVRALGKMVKGTVDDERASALPMDEKKASRPTTTAIGTDFQASPTVV